MDVRYTVTWRGFTSVNLDHIRLDAMVEDAILRGVPPDDITITVDHFTEEQNPWNPK